jgi:uncharacterized membrane protein
MTKDAFLAALRTHLGGLPPADRDEILADYASHFDEGVAAGRQPSDIAAALGDPARLARELKAEAGLKRWDEERSPGAAVGAVLAILSLGAIDLLILLPILMAAFSVILALFIAAAAIVVAGLVVIGASVTAFAGPPLASALAGIGLVAGGLALGALQTLLSIGLVNLLIRYGRFHMRLIKPVV